MKKFSLSLFSTLILSVSLLHSNPVTCMEAPNLYVSDPIIKGLAVDWVNLKFPESSLKSVKLTHEQETLRNCFIDKLFCLYADRVKLMVVARGCLPLDLEGIRKDISNLASQGVLEAQRFVFLELLGCVTTKYNTMLVEYPCLFPIDKRKAPLFILDATLEGNRFAATYFIKGMLEGKYGFKKIDESERMSFLEQFSLKGYPTARALYIDELRKENSAEAEAKSWQHICAWATQGDSRMRVRYLRASLVENNPLLPIEEAQKLLAAWTKEGDEYLKRHFNEEFERLVKEEELLDDRNWHSIFDEIIKSQTGQIDETQLAILRENPIPDFMKTILIAIGEGNADFAEKVRNVVKGHKSRLLSHSALYAKQGLKAARKLFADSLDSDCRLKFLEEWAYGGDTWAQKAYISHYIEEVEKTKEAKGSALILEAFVQATDEEDGNVSDLKVIDLNLNMARDWMQLWGVIPRQMNRSYFDDRDDSDCDDNDSCTML